MIRFDRIHDNNILLVIAFQHHFLNSASVEEFKNVVSIAAMIDHFDDLLGVGLVLVLRGRSFDADRIPFLVQDLIDV